MGVSGFKHSNWIRFGYKSLKRHKIPGSKKTSVIQSTIISFPHRPWGESYVLIIQRIYIAPHKDSLLRGGHSPTAEIRNKQSSDISVKGACTLQNLYMYTCSPARRASRTQGRLIPCGRHNHWKWAPLCFESARTGKYVYKLLLEMHDWRFLRISIWPNQSKSIISQGAGALSSLPVGKHNVVLYQWLGPPHGMNLLYI